MSRYMVLVVVGIVLFIVIGSWFFKNSAVVSPDNTPAGRQEVPVPGGTKGVPAERQNPG